MSGLRKAASALHIAGVARNHAAGIAAMNLLVVPTIGFGLLYVLVILGHHRRRILSFGVTSHPAAEW